MSRILALLSGYALPILATALVLTATAFGVQTWRINGLQEDRANLRAGLDQAVSANKSNQRTITALTVTNAQNAARYEAARKQAQEASIRADEFEARNRERADHDITAIQNTDDACGLSDMPDDTRMRLDPRRDRNGGSAGYGGAFGADRRETDPPASAA